MTVIPEFDLALRNELRDDIGLWPCDFRLDGLANPETLEVS